MTAKIFRNSFFVGLLVLLAAGILFLSVMYANDETLAFDELETEMAVLAPAVERLGLPYLQELDAAGRVTWIAADGSILYDNSARKDNMENHLAREEIAAALETGEGRATRDSQTGGARTHYIARRLSDGSVLRTACTQTSLARLILNLLLTVLWIVLLILVLCAAVSFRLARQITSPINQIDLDAPGENAVYPELRPLAARIREQNRTIRFQLTELSRRQQEFSAITEQMREGFLLLDANWDILSGNRSAKTLLALPQDAASLRGASLPPEAARAVEAALSGTHAEALLHLSDGVWQLTANPVASFGRPSGAVLLLMDVTEREEREALRREFSANVSHELKTPLTSISGFAELMQAGLVPMEKVQEFSADIYRESRRLLELVNDIIKLSRLDEGGDKLELQRVELHALVENVLANLESVAEKCHVTLSLTGGAAYVTGVPALLSEMLYNLCDNAIKYNVDGGSVRVDIAQSTAETVLTVSDTGIGIPYAHQSRVFERFYRVDKSHSKAVGGTGLGLSIVKHAAQYHNARLELKSAVGKGTEIRIHFPPAP